MQVTEQSAAAKTEEVAHTRSAVERWLCWSGLVPLPAFLALHLGRELLLATARDVSQVVRPLPGAFALVTSGLLVWLPLLVHAALGVWLLTSRTPRANLALDVARRARLFSRLCSVVALSFLLFHARQYPLATLLGEADARDAGFRLIAELSSVSAAVPVRGFVYLLGLAATVAHGGLGVHRALLGLGFLASESKRRASARLCVAASVLLFCIGAAAVIRVASGVLLR